MCARTRACVCVIGQNASDEKRKIKLDYEITSLSLGIFISTMKKSWTKSLTFNPTHFLQNSLFQKKSLEEV